jgi:hypothetical protein
VAGKVQEKVQTEKSWQKNVAKKCGRKICGREIATGKVWQKNVAKKSLEKNCGKKINRGKKIMVADLW